MFVIIKFNGIELKYPEAQKITLTEIKKHFNVLGGFLQNDTTLKVLNANSEISAGFYTLFGAVDKNKALEEYTDNEILMANTARVSNKLKLKSGKTSSATPESLYRMCRDKLREDVLKRDGYKCRITGLTIVSQVTDPTTESQGEASHIVKKKEIVLNKTGQKDNIPKEVLNVFNSEYSILSAITLADEPNYFFGNDYICINGTKIEYSKEAIEGTKDGKAVPKNWPENITVVDSPDWPPPIVFKYHRDNARARKDRHF